MDKKDYLNIDPEAGPGDIPPELLEKEAENE